MKLLDGELRNSTYTLEFFPASGVDSCIEENKEWCHDEPNPDKEKLDAVCIVETVSFLMLVTEDLRDARPTT